MVQKIAIVNCWHDSNKGDSAIVWGLLQNLFKIYPGLSVSLHTVFSSKALEYPNAFRHLKKEFPIAETFPSLLPNWEEVRLHIPYFRQFSSFLGKVWWGSKMLGSLGQIFLPQVNKKEIKVLKDADIIISKGGHYFYAPNGSIKDNLSIYFYSYPLLLAYRYKKPFVIYAQSVGPIKGNFSRFYLRTVFSRAALLSVRESISKDVLIDCGIPEERITLTPDSAFAIEVNRSSTVRRLMRHYNLKQKNILSITPRQWFGGSTDKFRAYLKALAQVGKYFVKKGLQVAVIAHCQGPTLDEDDKIACKNLFELLDGSGRVSLIMEDLSPPELAALYGECKISIGTRFHSVILSLISGTPTFAISYFGPKTFGIMRTLGLEAYTVDINNISSSCIISAVSRLLADEISFRNHILCQVNRLKKEIFQSVEHILELPTCDTTY